MKRTILCVISVIMLIAALSTLLWFNSTYLILNGQIYSRNSASLVITEPELPDMQTLSSFPNLDLLDIRYVNISCAEYDALHAALPECEILWLVPFGDGYYDNTAKKLVTTSLEESDFGNLRYFPHLETVDARGCRDYQALKRLMETYPNLTVQYTLYLGDRELSPDTEKMTIQNADLQDLRVILPYLPKVNKITFEGDIPANEELYEMKVKWPDIVFDWEFEVLGVTTRSAAQELDLSNIPVENTEAVAQYMKYFYDLQRVDMCGCGIPSLQMEVLCDQFPEIRFIWSFEIGTWTVRTDDISFISYKAGYHVNRPFYDDEAWELKYCVDMVSLDLGHMRMKDISFLKNMPKLKYLVLADTQASDYSVLAELEELVFLELFLSTFDDVEILLNLKNLEELNISFTTLKNPEVLGQMTWLKRLWMASCGMKYADCVDLSKSMSETKVCIWASHPTGENWRDSDRYRQMRDLQGMFYLD